MTLSPGSAPRRPVLAPGLRAVATANGDVQIGLGERHRLRLADSPALRRVLGLLERGEAVQDSPSSRRVLRQLAPALRDSAGLVHPRVPAAEVAAVTLRHPDAPTRLERRARQRVLLLGDLGLGPVLDPAVLLGRCGLQVVEPGARASMGLVLARGEPDRDWLDPLLHAGLPHVLVRAIEGDVVVGPFVSPGATACLRCIDAHEAEHDHARPQLLHEYWRTPRQDGVADPVDTATAVAALGFATGDLVRYAERDTPLTWSATVTLATGRPPADPVTWMRHQHCGCSWISEEPADDDRGSDTMGA